ncbi:MAG: hypothetical protein LV468_02590 [Candidatus Nitrosotenuis sp.]|nr:hypothetical protein [Candidatus Nitrosotenuis sp.]
MKNSSTTNSSKSKDLRLMSLAAAIGLLFSVAAVSNSIAVFADTSDDKAKDAKEKPKTVKDEKAKKHVKATKASKTETNRKAVQTPKQTSINTVEAELKACQQKETGREKYECEKAVKAKQAASDGMRGSTKYVIGPVTFYYAGAKVEKGGQKDIVNLKFTVENTGSKDNVMLYCTGPAACNYSVSDGKTTYRYSAQDFTNGQIVLKPGASRTFNMLFGPAIGYGSYVDFKFDASKQYTLNVNEPWGTGSIPLNLK